MLTFWTAEEFPVASTWSPEADLSLEDLLRPLACERSQPVLPVLVWRDEKRLS